VPVIYLGVQRASFSQEIEEEGVILPHKEQIKAERRATRCGEVVK